MDTSSCASSIRAEQRWYQWWLVPAATERGVSVVPITTSITLTSTISCATSATPSTRAREDSHSAGVLHGRCWRTNLLD